MGDEFSKYFTLKEISCKCGCGQALISPELYKIMDEIRAMTGEINVHCVNRCKKHNKEVGGVASSKHIKGQAMDCNSMTMDIKDFQEFLLNLWKDGTITDLGLYDTFVHVGIRKDRKYFWDNRTK